MLSSELPDSRFLHKPGSFVWAVRLAAITSAIVTGTVAIAQSPGEVPPSAQASLARFTTSSHAVLENKGQVADPVKFYMPGTRSVLFFTPSEIVLNVTPIRGRATDSDEDRPNSQQGTGVGLVVRIQFDGAKLHPSLEGIDEQKGKANVVRPNGENPEALKDIRRYGGVVYHDVFPGIDLECRAGKDGLQRTLVLDQGAKLDRVRFKYDGVENMRMGDGGQLELLTAIGVIQESPVYVRYKSDPTGIGPVMARYTLQGGSSVGVDIGKDK
ncbi:MAG: hypothetical protein K1Y02_07295 [Candidatus Hydrogenedentes bacterium]|nr:hypothetical protein [Candidatus Hydrogenedentota bacterium]